MNITRQNYEEYFLLYVDNELSIAERKAVDAFVQQHADLQEELKALQRSILRADKQVHFENKEELLKNVPLNPVNEINYEEYFVLYGDDELSGLEKEQVEQFVYKHPQYQVEFELILQAKLVPDNTITFQDKDYLYRSEESDKVIAFRWWRVVAAAVVILFLGSASLYLIRNQGDKQSSTTTGMASKLDKVDTNSSSNAGVPKNPVDKKERNIAVVPTQVNTDSNKGIAQNSTKKKAGTNNARENNELNKIASINSSKKNAIDSNKIINRNVPPIEDFAVDLSPKKIEGVKNSIETKAVVISSRPEINVSNLVAKTEPVAEQGGDDNGTDDYLQQTDNKKTKMRGLLRRVTRVFDKATSAEPNENGKSDVRIASFAIARN